MPPGIKEIMQRFGKVMTIEGNWSDNPNDEIIDETNRRYSALAMLLRSRYLVDVDCWSEVRGQPIKPGTIRRVLLEKLNEGRGGTNMTIAATECLLRMYEERHELEDYQGGRGALVHRLRRQRHPGGGAASLPRRGSQAGEDGVRLRHRLLEPLSPLHGDLRLPRHSRPGAAGRRRHQDGAAGPRRVRQHRRRRLLQHRRRPLDPRDPLQHEHDGDAARQSRSTA